ncbi:MAG: DUF1002 domain-containing protein [Tissierellia bacterium]|nr:DUF1002 domain-containing protein [Tissierellia bacterium]
MKKFARILALSLAIIMLLGVFASALAAGDEKWDKDVFAYGSGLNESQLKETAKILGIKDLDQVNKIKVDSEDLYKYLKEGGNDAGMISSLYLVKGEKNSGLQVVITSEENITQVTAEEYTNAALTAGIKDAKIYVGAYTPVTGTSALTGVYKSFELNGEKLDEDRVNLANEELETVNAIVREHKEKEDFDSSKLNKLVADVKESLIDYNNDNKDKASGDKIRDIIIDASTKYELNGIITQNNIDNLLVYFQNFQNSPAINSTELKKQLEKFGDDLSKKINDLVNSDEVKQGLENAKEGVKEGLEKAKNYANSKEARGLFQRIANFLREIFIGISNLFKGQ